MEKKKEDRRIVRTRTALRQALKDLVAEKGYDAVTVEDITERANLGRTTFYHHYRDKEDLFLEAFAIQLSGLMEEVSQGPLLPWFQENYGEITTSVFDMVLENREIFQVLLGEQKANLVYARFREIITGAAIVLVDTARTRSPKWDNPPIPITLVFDYFCGGLWASICWWVENDFNPTSKEMSDFFRKLFLPGLLYGLEMKKAFKALIE